MLSHESPETCVGDGMAEVVDLSTTVQDDMSLSLVGGGEFSDGICQYLYHI